MNVYANSEEPGAAKTDPAPNKNQSNSDGFSQDRHIPPKAPGMKQEIFALDTGEVTVQWPAALSEADFDDIGAWLKILERKIKRCVRNETDTPEPPDRPGDE